MDLMTSMKYAGGAALTGGAASAANMVFGVSVIGLLVFQFARSTPLSGNSKFRLRGWDVEVEFSIAVALGDSVAG